MLTDEPREDGDVRELEHDGLSLKTARPVDSSVEPSDPIKPCQLTAKRSVWEIIFVFAFLFIPFIIRYLIFGYSSHDLAEKAGVKLYWMVIANGFAVTVAIFIVLYLDRHSLSSVGLHLKNWRGEILAAILTLMAIYALQALIGKIVDIKWPHFSEQAVRQRIDVAKMFPKISPLYLLAFTLCVGFYEELLFRGFLMARLENIFKNVWLALVVSSLIFGAAHFYQDPLAMFQIFTIAIILGGLFILRKSLISPILIHTAFNFINLMTAIYFIQKFVR